MKKYLMMLVVLSIAVTSMAELYDEFAAFDIKMNITYYNGTEKMQAVLVDVYHGETNAAFVVRYEKGEIEFVPVEEFYAAAEGRYAAAQLVMNFYGEYALFTSFGKTKRDHFQTKGVGLLVDEGFLDGPSPYFNVALRYNSKLTGQMSESDMDHALAAYLAKKTKLSETYILEEIWDFLDEVHGEI